MAPEVDPIGTIFLDKTIRRAVLLERFKSSEIKKILSFMDEETFPQVLSLIEKDISKVRVQNRKIASGSKKRYSDFRKSLRRLMRESSRGMSAISLESLEEFARADAAWQASMMSETINIPSLSLEKPTSATLRQIVRGEIVEGALLKDWWRSVGTNGAREIERSIAQGIVDGDGIDQIVRRIRGTRAFNGVFKGIRRDAEAITRTAITHVSARAREETFSKNDDIVKGYQYVATLDSRTTVICASLDGQVFEPNKGRRPPQHINCRSTVIPVTKAWWELGVPREDVPATTRASMRGQVAAKMTYPEWLRKQSKAIQDEALGPKRAALFRQGVDIDKFVSPNSRPLTLDEIQKLSGVPEIPDS